MPRVTEKDQAEMLMLAGMNWDYDEIAAEVGVSESTVGKYINEFEDGSKAADDWKRYARNVLLAGALDDVRESLYGSP